MLEWLKRHAWKACKRRKRFAGSNPALSAYFQLLVVICHNSAILYNPI